MGGGGRQTLPNARTGQSLMMREISQPTARPSSAGNTPRRHHMSFCPIPDDRQAATADGRRREADPAKRTYCALGR